MNVVLRISLVSLLSLTAACQQKSADDHDHNEHGERGDGVASGNQALYDEVMGIHDEVMPKMDDLYKAKMALKNKIASTPDMPESEKKEMNAKIAKLDSASEGMMVWMRQFNPLPDSLGEDQAKEYLEGELAKVKNVKEEILTALQDAASKE